MVWKTARLMAATAAAVGLSGCFTAENDDTNPIIPDSSLSYPLALGSAQECEESNGAQRCSRARLERLPAGGYRLTVWSKDDDGTEGSPQTSEYKMRALRGGAVPAGSYLVQSIANQADERYLGLMTRQPDGGWRRHEPNCDGLRPSDFVNYVNNNWIKTDSGSVDGMQCEVKRMGLTDSRMFTILDGAKKDSTPKILYTGR